MIISTDLKDFYRQILDEKVIQIIQDYINSKQSSYYFRHGEKEILPKGISVITLHSESGTGNKNILEAHRMLYDIHYTIQGTDTIAYKAVKECNNISQNYQEEGDYILYNEKPEGLIEVVPGHFCYIPNVYAHSALYENKGIVKKLVFKVPEV